MTLTATASGTGPFTYNWSAAEGTVKPSSDGATATYTIGSVPSPASVTVSVTASNAGGTSPAASVTLTVNPSLSVSFTTAPPSTITNGVAVQLVAAPSGGDGNGRCAAWSVSPSPDGSFSSTSACTTSFTPSATGQVTLTVGATDSSTPSSAGVNATASTTVMRSIKFAIALTNNEAYLDFPGLIDVTMTCTGCQASTDTLNEQSVTFNGPVLSQAMSTFASVSSWQEALNFTLGGSIIPGTIKEWISGSDGATSNVVYFTVESENMAAQDPNSGTTYYCNTGNGTSGSAAIQEYDQSGTALGNFGGCGNGIAVDPKTRNILVTFSGSVDIYEPQQNGLPQAGPAAWVGSGTTNVLAIDANYGLSCVTIPGQGANSGYCFYEPTASNNQVPSPFQLPSMGSYPTAIKVLDANDVVVFCRGDNTLRFYTISGSTATAGTVLTLSQFSPTSGNWYTSIFQGVGGWDMAVVDNTIVVMGQVVDSSNGTAAQEVAFVDPTTQTLLTSIGKGGYVTLPPGTVHITADPTANAVAAEYEDFSVAPGVNRSAEVNVMTGTVTKLTATSPLIPGAGFLVTNNGGQIATFVGGQASFIPKQ